jgi:hypothetical protein
LDKWINEPPSDSSDDELKGANIFTAIDRVEHRRLNQTESKKTYEPTEDDIKKVCNLFILSNFRIFY